MSYWMKRKEEERRMIANGGESAHPNGWYAPWSCRRREMNERWNQMQAPSHIPQSQQQYESKYQTQGGRGWNGADDGLVPGAVAAASGVDSQSTQRREGASVVPPHHHGDVHSQAAERIKDASRQAGDAVRRY